MARLAISELTTFRWTLDEDLEHYKAAGAAAIGVWRRKLADAGESRGAELIAASGLAVSSLQWAGGFTGSDGHSHQESIADARQAIDAAVTIGARCLIIHSGARGSHTHNHARRLLNLALAKLLPLAEERGIVLALEPMKVDCGGEFTFINCFEEALKLIDEYKSPAIGLALDTYHWGHQPLLLERLGDLAKRLALVQLGDGREPPRGEPNRCLLGHGTIPLREIIARLTSAGYDGFYEVELMGEEIEAADYRDVLAHSVRTFREWTGEESKVQSPKSKVAPS